jgi:uncharacterized repeat protein (TIGR01451 family)
VVTVTATNKGDSTTQVSEVATTTVLILPGLLDFDKEIVETTGIDPDPAVVYPGDLITYTVGITNDGGFDLTNLVITDVLDGALDLDSAVEVLNASGNPHPGVSVSTTGDVIVLTFATFPYVGGNSVANITFRARVSDTAVDNFGNGYVIENSAQALHDNTPVVVGTNIVTNVLYEPPILLDLAANPNPVVVGFNTMLSGTLQAPARVFTVTWNFGDGTTSGPTPQGDPNNPDLDFNNQYEVPGLYTATLTAENGHYSSPVTATVVITVTPDFQLLKVAEPASGVAVLPGETITYTVVLTNGAGSGTTPDLNGIVLTDALPGGTQFVTGTVVNGNGVFLANLSESGGSVVYNVGSLPNIDQVPLNVIRATIVVTVTGAQGDVLTNTAYGSYNGFMPDFGPVTTVHPVGAAPRLEISKTADPTGASTILNRLHAGDLITYTITLVNNGPATPGGTATNVVITDTLPAMVDLIDPGLGTVNGTVITWAFPSLAGGGAFIQDTVVVSVSEQVNAQTETIVLTNVVEAISDQTALISDTTIHYADPLPILEISKSADPLTGTYVSAEDIISYTIVVANVGYVPGTSFVLTDVLPANTTYVNNSVDAEISSGGPMQVSSPDTSSPNSIIVSKGNSPLIAEDLQPGEIVTLTFQVQADSVPVDTLVSNVAEVEVAELDVENSVPATHTIGVPVLNLAKTAVSDNEAGYTDRVYPADTITYTLVLRNDGNGDMVDPLLVDTLPAVPGEVAYIGSTPTAVQSGNVLTWDLSGVTLASGQSLTGTVVVTVTANISGTVLTNTAVAQSNLAQTYSFTSNTAIVAHTVVSKPVLLLTKLGAEPVSGADISINDPVTYTLIVTVTGAPVTNLQLTDIVPDNTLYTDDLGDSASINCGDGTVSFTQPGPNGTPAGTSLIAVPNAGCGSVLQPGTVMILNFLVEAQPVAIDTVITNYFTVDVDELLPRDSDDVTHTIRVPVFNLTKSAVPASGQSVEAGSQIIYTLVLENSGGRAENTVLTDTLPMSVALNSANPAGSVTDNVISWNLGDFAGGATLTAVLTVTIDSDAPAGMYLTNTAEVASDYGSGIIFSDTSQTVHRVIDAVNRYYLPYISKNFVAAADLRVIDIDAGTDQVVVVIQNVGSVAANPLASTDGGFWVDFYGDPIKPPQFVNDTWDNGFSNEGATWLVTKILQPGEQLILRTGIGQPYYRANSSTPKYNTPGTGLPGGRTVYAHVDSANTAKPAYGAVLEGHEPGSAGYNNIRSEQTTGNPVTITGGSEASVSAADGSGGPDRP